jgi:hypothetical protein
VGGRRLVEVVSSRVDAAGAHHGGAANRILSLSRGALTRAAGLDPIPSLQRRRGDVSCSAGVDGFDEPVRKEACLALTAVESH